MSEQEPIEFVCPQCHAEKGEDCRYGGDVGYHLSRFDVAAERPLHRRVTEGRDHTADQGPRQDAGGSL